MGRQTQVVRLSSKGQIIIPAKFRRQLGLKTGQPLAVHAQGEKAIVFTPLDRGSQDLEAMLERARSWVERTERDLVGELHLRRSKERQQEAKDRDRRRP